MGVIAVADGLLTFGAGTNDCDGCFELNQNSPNEIRPTKLMIVRIRKTFVIVDSNFGI